MTAMKKGIDENSLHRLWVHSHEEDTGTETVFRPATFAFPRSRGRASMDFKPGGDLIETGPGSDDRPRQRRASWKLVGSDTLVLYEKGGRKPARTMKIASLDKDRLVLKA